MSKSSMNQYRLDGKGIIITGGAGKLGRSHTRTLLEAGGHVAVIDKREEVFSFAEKAENETAGHAIGLQIDITRQDQVEEMVEQVSEAFGSIDILVNNAALDPNLDKDEENQHNGAFEDYPLELWNQYLNVNLTGSFLCSQAVGTRMAEEDGGVIVNIGSTYGVVSPDQSIYTDDETGEQSTYKPASYCVTKAGLIHLSRYLATYWKDKNIRVNSLTPGGVEHNQEEQFKEKYAGRTPLGRMAEKSEISAALLFLVSDASSYMTGANLVVDGGWTTW